MDNIQKYISQMYFRKVDMYTKQKITGDLDRYFKEIKTSECEKEIEGFLHALNSMGVLEYKDYMTLLDAIEEEVVERTKANQQKESHLKINEPGTKSDDGSVLEDWYAVNREAFAKSAQILNHITQYIMKYSEKNIKMVMDSDPNCKAVKFDFYNVPNRE